MRVSNVTKEIIEAWKQEYRAVYKTNIADQDFYFRPLTRQELNNIRELMRDGNLSVDEFDEKIVDYCLLSPDWMIADFLSLEAGVLSSLSRAIQERSLIGAEPTTQTVFDQYEKIKVPQEVIEQNRLHHKRMDLVTLAGHQVLVRPLLRSEWNSVTKMQQEDPGMDIDREVCKTGLLFPAIEDLEALPGGFIQKISDSIMEISGFGETPSVERL